MAISDYSPELFPTQNHPAGLTQINGHCQLQTFGKHRVVIVSGVTYAQYSINDRMSEAQTMVNLIEQDHARQSDVARAFGCATRTVRRYQNRFADGGLSALARVNGYPKGLPRLPLSRDRLVTRLKNEGRSNCYIARQVGVCEKAVRKQLKRLGWQEKMYEQPLLPLSGGSDPKVSASLIPVVSDAIESDSGASDPNLSAWPELESFDCDPGNRAVDRLCARAGLLYDAMPLFQPGIAVPRAGVLLAIPALTATSVFQCAKTVFGDLGPAFYGLRTTVLTMLLLALLRIKRPEALKEYSPPDLGRLIGLDRAPEVKTLRSKLSELAIFNRAVLFGRELARCRVQTHSQNLGFLYADGHVRVYHGKHSIPKTHVARMRLPMPGTSDYWINDQSGEPLFVITAEANAGLARMLPPLLAEIRTLIGERRITIVFDRGGWSPKLFRNIIAQGFDILTYRKGRFRRVPLRCFQEYEAVIDGHAVAYSLSDQGIRLSKGMLRLRQITRLCPGGHQTPIITSRRDLSAIEVAYRMFERWRQENFFKYLREEYALDALADYQVEPGDSKRSVPNPKRVAADHKLRLARLQLQRLATQYGLDEFASNTTRRKMMRGFQIASSEIGKAIKAAELRVIKLEQSRSKLPVRVPVSEVVDGEVVRLSTERKHLTNCFKLVAHQAESELVNLVGKYYHRAEDEGRTLIQSAFASAADMVPTETELRVILAPMSSPHRTKAIAALCADLNACGTVFPGTKLRLRYSISE